MSGAGRGWRCLTPEAGECVNGSAGDSPGRMVSPRPSSRRPGAGVVGLVLLALMAGDAVRAQEESTPTDPPEPSTAPGPGAYVIGKEDVVQISVWGEQALSLERVPVRPDGRISVPLLGDVMAAGETPEGLGRRLTELYKAHVVAPAVTVVVVEINSFKIYMLGNIKTPGVLKLGRETTLLQALAQVGGFTEFASTRKILVLREDDDALLRLEINYDRIISGQNLEMNIRLKPGDTVVIP